MRVLLFLILGLMTGLRSAAQSVSIVSENAHVEYYRMPDHPLDPSYKTYSAELDVSYSQLGKMGWSESYIIDKYLVLEGYKKVNSKGDIEITASIGDFDVWSETTRTSHTKKKDKEGNETIKYAYKKEVRYGMSVSLQVYTRSGQRLLDKIVNSGSDTRTWTSSNYNSLSELDTYWRIQRQSKLQDLQKDLLELKLKDISNEINLAYGFQRLSDVAKFETIGKKKHEEYENYQTNVEIIKTAFKLMSADYGLEDIKVKIKPALSFYNANVAKCKSNSKDDMKLRHINLYNQALAYYWMEEFDKSEGFVKEIQKSDSKDKDAKRLLADIEYARASLLAAGRKSRHGTAPSSRS